MQFPGGHSILIKTFIPWRIKRSRPASALRISSPFLTVVDTDTSMKQGQRKRCISRTWTVSKSLWETSIANAFLKRFAPNPFTTTPSLPHSTLHEWPSPHRVASHIQRPPCGHGFGPRTARAIHPGAHCGLRC